MITVTCDKCERELTFDDAQAGQKVECPHCGDVNRLPGGVPPSGPASGPAGRRDRAVEAGYPPDSGEERRVAVIRRCWARSRPGAFGVAVLAVAGGLAGLAWSGVAGEAAWIAWGCLVVVLVGLGAIAWWWVERLTAVLEITNKRTVARQGLLSRSTSEVVHDNIRNVRVDQSVWQRVWGVGKLGISSSGQDGIEIEMNHLRSPDKVRKIIDLYRPL